MRRSRQRYRRRQGCWALPGSPSPSARRRALTPPAAAARIAPRSPPLSVTQAIAGTAAFSKTLGQFDEGAWTELLLFLFLIALTVTHDQPYREGRRAPRGMHDGRGCQRHGNPG